MAGGATNKGKGLRALAAKAHMSMSDYVTACCLGKRIVVIDDPPSLLDREALFATHKWLVDTPKGFGQYIVLTPHFSLLRLFVKSRKSR